MKLGAFSISLTVKDINASKAFYEKLGFEYPADWAEENWVILKNGDCVIGLFQGMFDKNMLTFNPGWDQGAQKMEDYTDVRDLQSALKEQGVDIINEIEEGTSGPASFLVVDPDGNPILIDQHV